MLRGFTTVSFFADDVPAATAWYTEVFGIEPYFVRPVEGPPAYVEFRVGDYQHEFGIIDSRFSPHGRSEKPAGAVIYWAVDDARAAYHRLLAMGATTHEEPTERGPGFVTASVIDPFGNILGVMYNEHYLGVLEARAGA
ncbi:VOC family protein [Phytoactinopolyspora mesophila]|uniref:VOC family protein n=1 Tax=Phytoactinopolyspora mesophila TaxID=2650750 RepID=A0A7K3M3T5_9ACTN|nr:VOC family protein [Phytoactinopolyspora mesophila]NDL57905.1 VOC family protein [Phytoactinopolyspora mesophila]